MPCWLCSSDPALILSATCSDCRARRARQRREQAELEQRAAEALERADRERLRQELDGVEYWVDDQRAVRFWEAIRRRRMTT